MLPMSAILVDESIVLREDLREAMTLPVPVDEAGPAGAGGGSAGAGTTALNKNKNKKKLQQQLKRKGAQQDKAAPKKSVGAEAPRAGLDLGDVGVGVVTGVLALDFVRCVAYVEAVEAIADRAQRRCVAAPHVWQPLGFALVCSVLLLDGSHWPQGGAGSRVLGALVLFFARPVCVLLPFVARRLVLVVVVCVARVPTLAPYLH